MATIEERMKILEMVASGKISAAEAARLLNPAVGAEDVEEAAKVPPAPAAAEMALPAKEEHGASAPSWLRIRVDDTVSGRSKVSVNVPLRLMKFGLQLGSSFAPELRNVEWETLSALLADGEDGLLVEVQDEEDGEHVRIFVE